MSDASGEVTSNGSRGWERAPKASVKRIQESPI